MKHLRLLRSCALLASALFIGDGLHAQVAISAVAGGAAPNPHAMLDLSQDPNPTRGFLAPRVTNATRPPAATAANSLFIYQTDSVAGAPRGFYYFDATLLPAPGQWVHAATAFGWKLGGNAGTTAGVDFIGTTNAQPLVLRTAGVQRAILQTAGQLQLGETPLQAASEVLDVKGAVKITGAASGANTEGTIRFNAATGAHEGYVNNAYGGTYVAPQIPYVGWYQLENAFKVRVKQKYQTVPVVSCQRPTIPPFPAPGVVVTPAGATAGSWPRIDVNGAAVNPSTAATLETPFSMFWEDGRHQYLYLSQDLVNLNICPNTNITGLAFQTASAGSGLGMRNIRINMKNTGTAALSDLELTGLQLVHSTAITPFVPVNGWNAFNFNVSNWQWLGPGFNMLVEYAFDNQDWTNDCPVYYEGTTYNAMAGLRCDACGHQFTFGNTTCTWLGGVGATCGGGTAPCTIPPNNNPPVPPMTYPPTNQSPQVFTDATHIQCQGWGHTPGWALTFLSSPPTCDCTFQYTMATGVTARRPLLAFNAEVNGVGVTYPNGSYLLAQKAVLVGDYATWANSALYTGPPGQPYPHRGPGTLSARSSVWGGSVLLNDHVFDSYYDGTVKPEDGKQAMGYRHYPLQEMTEFVEQEHHLPTIAGREMWEKTGQFSVDQLTNQLWVTVETQSIYIKELNERMNALQEYLVQKRLKELKK